MNTILWHLMLLLNISAPLVATTVLDDDKFVIEISGIYKPESFFGENISSFNKNDRADRIFFARHTLDGTLNVILNDEEKSKEIIHFCATVRNKAPWGTAEGIVRTTPSTIKMNEVVLGEHTHGLPRNIFWMRENYAKVSLGDFLSLPLHNEHTLTIGSFAYQLGRGIALGDAYAVGPESLGFYSDASVDQFAYGMLFTDELIKDKLTHEFYIALLQNKCASLSDTNAKIFGQAYGKLENPKRQFGSANFVISGSLHWDVFKKEKDVLKVNPYWLFNHESEQYVEFFGDASAKLGTCGLASEAVLGEFEVGFDCAINMGRQQVKGWDRNQIVMENREGMITTVNTSVYAGDPRDTESVRLVYVPGSATQKYVDRALRSATQNGQEILGVQDEITGGSSVFNASNRFRDPYKNIFNGWMATADAAYWCVDHSVRIAGMAAIASGDEHPNFKPEDGSYTGFIGLQELYSGDRVKSAFLLGGAGKAKRPFSKPTFEQAPDKFQNSVVSGFSNLMVVGSSVLWKPITSTKKLKLHTNVLAYWQQYPTGNARPYLGVEGNVFFNCELLEGVELFSIASFFVPGSFYTDRKDKAFLTIEQLTIADQPDVTGFTADPVPGLNDHVAFTFNIGLKFSF